MTSIARGQENTTDRLNWFISVNCQLTDAYEVGFQIWDQSAGAPGTQVFPATPDEWEDVTLAPGKFSVGSYYAYDNDNTQGWTPSIAEPLGAHLIKWRWKITAGSPYQASSQEFDVLVESAGSPSDTYITVQDIRDEGLDDTVADDAKVLDYIETWQAFLDRACRQWFRPRQLTVRFDGTESDTLHLGVPIIGLDYLRINDDVGDLDTDLYRVYSNNTMPDDRHNPRICLWSSSDDIFRGFVVGGKPMCFRRGRQNHELKGQFGFVDENQQAPRMIQRALTKLVIEKLVNPIYPSSSSSVPVPSFLGPVLEERTDGHFKKYGWAGGAVSSRRPGLSGITNDAEVLDIIKLYKAPIGIATPVDWRV